MFTQEEPVSKEQGPVIREILDPKIISIPQVVSQPSREVHCNPQPTGPVIDKRKQKVVENRYAGLVSRSVEGPQGMMLHEIEVERVRKENEDLKRELEKAEIEALNTKFRRKIRCLKAPAIREDHSNPTSQHTSTSLLNTQPMIQMNAIPLVNQSQIAAPSSSAIPSSAIPTNQTS